MKLSTGIVTAVLLVAGSSGAVYAFGKHGDRGMTPAEKAEFVTERVSKKLEPDAAQRQNFSELADLVAGIAAEESPRLTEAFYRPDGARGRNTGGYGLGLYLCKLLIGAHHGHMSIASEPGKGTRVIVSLPRDNS